MNWQEDYLYYFLNFLCIVVFFLHKETRKQYWFLSFLIIGIITDLAVRFSGGVWIYHFYHLAELTLVSFSFYHEINKESFRKWVRVSYPFFLLLSIVGVLIDGLNEISLSVMCISSTTLILYSLYYLRHIQFPPFKSKNIMSNLFFWIAASSLFYFSGVFVSLFVEGFSDNLPYLASTIGAYIVNITNYLFYLLLIIGITCRKLFK